MIQLLILVGGLALVFLTEHDTFGWILTGLGALLLFVPLLLMLLVAAGFRKAMKDDGDFFTTTHGRTIKRRP
jgi:hypothetical protein